MNRQYAAVALLAVVGVSLMAAGAVSAIAPVAFPDDPSGSWGMIVDGAPVACWVVTPYNSTIAENVTLYHWERVNCSG